MVCGQSRVRCGRGPAVPATAAGGAGRRIAEAGECMRVRAGSCACVRLCH